MKRKALNILSFLSLWLMLALVAFIPIVWFCRISGLDTLLDPFDYSSKQTPTGMAPYVGMASPIHYLRNRFLIGGIAVTPILLVLHRKLINHTRAKIIVIVIGTLLLGGSMILKAILGI